MTPRTAALAVALALLAAALAGCGGGRLEHRRLSDVEAALGRAGLQVCEAETPDDPAGDADDERLLTVARRCGAGTDSDDEATVVVVAWPNRGARDAALRRFDVQSRPSAQNHGITWAYGQFTVHVSGERDDAVVDRVVDAMHELGAS